MTRAYFNSFYVDIKVKINHEWTTAYFFLLYIYLLKIISWFIFCTSSILLHKELKLLSFIAFICLHITRIMKGITGWFMIQSVAVKGWQCGYGKINCKRDNASGLNILEWILRFYLNYLQREDTMIHIVPDYNG